MSQDRESFECFERPWRNGFESREESEVAIPEIIIQMVMFSGFLLISNKDS